MEETHDFFLLYTQIHAFWVDVTWMLFRCLLCLIFLFFCICIGLEKPDANTLTKPIRNTKQKDTETSWVCVKSNTLTHTDTLKQKLRFSLRFFLLLRLVFSFLFHLRFFSVYNVFFCISAHKPKNKGKPNTKHSRPRPRKMWSCLLNNCCTQSERRKKIQLEQQKKYSQNKRQCYKTSKWILLVLITLFSPSLSFFPSLFIMFGFTFSGSISIFMCLFDWDP